ncbi:hypothetical protein AVEN_264608-1 [Araneus ventricosus]|uniref:Integrase zinc-binding domain-containing protein n=1 Tax=Araneus ventricosus TaxID=182803 RepID=A0A4Y2FSP2_ARAVE|nr:hypothetical protein AVEN_264608-1 [Araneus ventricosus]
MVILCFQNFEIPKIWELEKLGIVDPTKRKTTKLLEDETLAHFQEIVEKTDHRYEAALPRLASHPPVILRGSAEKATLHIFTDASAYDYACCALLRCEEEKEGKVSLVLAKARVALVKRPTISRLELLGAAFAARIALTILEALNFPLKMYFWTDSMIVLGWITITEPWNTFVGNGVKEIRELTNVEDWRFVPGGINPADLPSRSCDWSELLRSRWWEGPKWLYECPEFWPYKELTLPEEAMIKRRKTVVVNLNIEPKDRSRLILGQDPEDFVRPIVLPDHPIVRRLIDYAHKTLHNAGVQTTLSQLRERFWTPLGRRVVKEVLQKCVTCFRYTSKPVVPVVPAPLPVDRINCVAAFEVTGADLADPIYLKGGEKAWIVIFTCAVYLAIHLELVASLSTEAFMEDMQRFFC